MTIPAPTVALRRRSTSTNDPVCRFMLYGSNRSSRSVLMAHRAMSFSSRAAAGCLASVLMST